MPAKKKSVEQEEKPVAEQPKKAELCGHINQHFYNEKGEKVELKCTLEKGHQGDHSAKHNKNVFEQEYNLKGQVTKTNVEVVEAIGTWSDAAGTPVQEIKEETGRNMSAWQKDIVMDILKANPNMDAKTAVAQAKLSEVWAIGDRSRA